ncbi:superoxide dismutase [Paraburkholderia sp. CI3]|uniref:superoxide dismutase n=1 Tax=Paraburkholderia sp. CI3 TaxID=2991060 RepID=UPI003D1A9695
MFNELDDIRSSRRGFMQLGALGAAGLAAAALPASSAFAATQATTRVPDFLPRSPLTLPPLPYAESALEPILSAKTIGLHYGKHHKAYFDNIAKLVANTPFADMSLEELVVASAGRSDREPLFNNAAQAWNHTFYWNSMTPASTAPQGELKAMIERDFGSLNNLKNELATTAVSQFGSGWGWLVVYRGHLKVVKTGNADLPFVHGMQPLLTVDVWEHAYYLQYQNRRPAYVAAVMDKLLNWEFASSNLPRA